jgi:hypothetical protein
VGRRAGAGRTGWLCWLVHVLDGACALLMTRAFTACRTVTISSRCMWNFRRHSPINYWRLPCKLSKSGTDNRPQTQCSAPVPREDSWPGQSPPRALRSTASRVLVRRAYRADARASPRAGPR